MKYLYLFLSLIVFVLVGLSSSIGDFDNWVTFTAVCTLMHAIFSVIILKKSCRQWTSLPLLFLFFLFLFNWGQVWLLGFFKNYELQYDWNKISIYPQYIYIKTCLAILFFITFFVIGVVSRVKQKYILKNNHPVALESCDYSRMKIIGIVILILTLPFNIYENALYIATSIAFGYQEIFILEIPDFVTVLSWLSIIGAVSLMIGFKNKEKYILLLFVLLYGVEMASGNRAQSVVAILTLFMFFNLIKPIKLSAKKIVLYIGIGFLGLTVLQSIKNFRGAEGKDIGNFWGTVQETTLEKNVILQNLEEFGGAIAFPSIMLIYLQQTNNYLLGWTYLSGLAGIFPNIGGEIAKITNSGSVVYVVRDHIYGEYQTISCSNVSEAVMNYGIWGIPIFALIVGWVIGYIYTKTEKKRSSIKLLYYVMPSYALIFWVRNSFQSTVRYVVWGAIIIWLLEKLTRSFRYGIKKKCIV